MISTRDSFRPIKYGNSGRLAANEFDVLYLHTLAFSHEFEMINQEILDGLGMNKALLNAEGPTYGGATIGVEVMIDKLEAWRKEMSEWVEQKIYLPIAKMKGFVEKNEWGQPEYIYPRIKWDTAPRERTNERGQMGHYQ